MSTNLIKDSHSVLVSGCCLVGFFSSLVLCEMQELLLLCCSTLVQRIPLALIPMLCFFFSFFLTFCQHRVLPPPPHNPQQLSKRLCLIAAIQQKVTGVKKTDGTSREDFKLY